MTLTRRLWGYIALAVAGAALGVWLVTLWLPGWLVDKRTRDGAAATGNAADGAPGDARRISATLFYVAPGGDGLIAVSPSRNAELGRHHREFTAQNEYPLRL